ncbi:hypothetical protein KFL_003230200 [Klebsormidium nitens]|uniref:Cytochrome b561 domain-containing protein n=1 Tax=Klebsormidium nitens TaxID=105231 RepID=A0A1Y1I7N2_KLENI|nr:hypothetical protein KFL_003230200 [Klebsormidium nitens]|eukprot:GAQ86975.1 hypothetical protein KFL_003230200 [Klebsormidium nitens]
MAQAGQEKDLLTKIGEVSVQVLGILSLLLVIVWSVHFRGGLAWSIENKGLIFNWHPILMVTAFVFLASEGVLAYRLFPGTHQLKKAIHLTVQLVALIIAAVGITAAFRFHNESKPPIDNLYSLHSWFGVTTYSLFALQWLGGCYTFWYPGAAPPTRSWFLPYHASLGIFIYILALTTASQGILEKLTFLQSGGAIGRRSTETILANCLGLVIFALGGVVLALAPRPKPRGPDPDLPEYRPLE